MGMMQLHEKIRLIRQFKGWSQEETANYLEMSASAYGSIERGETDVNYSRLQQISRVFGMDVADLITLGEHTAFNFIGENNHYCCSHWRIDSPVRGQEELLHELEKKDILLIQKDLLLTQKQMEIEYLKQQNADLREMLCLLKKQT